jgi:hypothetical protein
MAESGLTRGLTKQTQFSSTTIYSDGLPLPAEFYVHRSGGPRSSIIVASIGRQFVSATDT